MAKRNNIFTDQESFSSIDTYRLLYFILCCVFYAITELGRFVYRPYIYENSIKDWGLADSIGNLFGICVQVFLGLVVFNSPYVKGKRLILFFTCGYILYEIVQQYLPKGVFDWYDIAGTLMGGTISLFIYMLIHKLNIKNRIFYTFHWG